MGVGVAVWVRVSWLAVEFITEVPQPQRESGVRQRGELGGAWVGVRGLGVRVRGQGQGPGSGLGVGLGLGLGLGLGPEPGLGLGFEASCAARPLRSASSFKVV